MSNFKTFFLNGQQYFTNYELNILELITYFNYNAALFVLEYNNKICERKNWDKIVLKNNDKIEIITIVGGG